MAGIWSTEADFDTATKTAICSYLGILRFGTGHDFGIATGIVNNTGSFARRAPGMCVNLNNAAQDNFGSVSNTNHSDGTVRGRVIGFVSSGGVYDCGIAGRCAGAGVLTGYLLKLQNTNLLRLYKWNGGAGTQLATAARTFTNGQEVDLRLVFTGTTIDGYDDTAVVSLTATDAAIASGNIGFCGGWSLAIQEAVRLDSAALSGSASLPTSTTYEDYGSAVSIGRVAWNEDLSSGGDVTVDVYGSDNGTSDAAGASVTGLTDPAGSDCSAAGSHRYWRVVVNFTRDNTTQEPTVSRIALAQTAAAVVLAITTTSLDDGQINKAYNAEIDSTGGTSPYTYAVTAGALPAGLSLSSGGVISGTPTAVETASFTVTVTDNASATDTQALTIDVNGGGGGAQVGSYAKAPAQVTG